MAELGMGGKRGGRYINEKKRPKPTGQSKNQNKRLNKKTALSNWDLEKSWKRVFLDEEKRRPPPGRASA